MSDRWRSVTEAVRLIAPWILYRVIWTPVIRFISTQLTMGRAHMSLPHIAFTCGCVAMIASLLIKRYAVVIETCCTCFLVCSLAIT